MEAGRNDPCLLVKEIFTTAFFEGPVRTRFGHRKLSPILVWHIVMAAPRHHYSAAHEPWFAATQGGDKRPACPQCGGRRPRLPAHVFPQEGPVGLDNVGDRPEPTLVIVRHDRVPLHTRPALPYLLCKGKQSMENKF